MVRKKAIRVVPPRLEDGYLYHTVAKGETKYFLSKRYKTDIATLEKLNPEITRGLRVGQVLRIDITQARTDSKVANLPPKSDGLMRHEVKPKETLYSLSQLYKVAIDSIRAVNPGMEYELKIGQIIKIPKPIMVAAVKVDEPPRVLKGQTFVDTLPVKDRYNVAMLLPLFLDENDTMETKMKPSDPPSIYRPSIYSLEFMHGFKIALEEQRQRGLSVNLHVFDTNNDSMQVRFILGSPRMKDMHLFVGPFNHRNVNLVAKHAVERGVHVVCPVDQSNKVLLSNPNVSKVESSNVTQVEKLANYVARKHHRDNVVMIDSKNMRDDLLERIFRNRYNSSLKRLPGARRDSLKVATMEKYTVKDLTAKLDMNKVNVLVMPSGDKSLISDLLTRVHGLSRKTYLFQVYGIQKWLSLDNIEPSYKHDLNLHVTSGHFVDYESMKIREFLGKYRAEYNTDPGRYAILGYDVGSYYLTGLREYGTDFPDNFEDIKANLLHMRFNHQDMGPESGYENKNVYILHYEDFRILSSND